jgi:penicillin amidase
VKLALRTVLRVLLTLLALVLIVFAVAVWWLVYRPLPQLDGKAKLPGLQGEVIVERDNWGVPHIRAFSVEDAVEAQGYVVAQDRLWQMDLLRRASRGQLSEILGKSTLKIDKDFRNLNFGRAAERDLQGMGPESRRLLEAYARGVNRFIEQHQDTLPMEFTLLKYKPQPWQLTDTLVLTGYMYRTLTDTREREIQRALVTTRAGPDLAKELFSEESSMDHFVVGDPNVKDKANPEEADDEDDDEDQMDSEDVLRASLIAPDTLQTMSEPDLTSLFARQVRGWLREGERDIRGTLGSNNWVVSGAHSATGKPLLANDTHLELTIPPIWYELHVTAPGWNVKGLTFPGAPLVIIGHNDHIAWGFTNNGADVQDLYIETFNPANPNEYRVNGKWQKAEVYDEVIRVKGERDEHMRLVVTRHGPVLQNETDKAYALKWTALEPGGLTNSYNWLGKAHNWKQFRELMKTAWGPAQNAVYADVDGNIGYLMAARVPIRKKGHGEVPVPGDTDEYEWSSYIPFEQLPQTFNPESGFIVTANARVTGPGYKPYLTDRWEEPYRTARIYDLLHDKHDLRPEDMLKVETDTYSYPHVFIGEQLVAAAKVAPPKDARAQKLIQQAKDWNGTAETSSVVVSFLDKTMYGVLEIILQPHIGDNPKIYSWRKLAFLQRILTERPAKWLPADFKNYDELLTAAADRAVERLEEQTGSGNPEDWAWKQFNALEMLHPIGREGILRKLLSKTGEPQAGTMNSPRASSHHHGPAMRFVANLGDWDHSILVIPTGQSGQPGSEHYMDQFAYWFNGKPIYAPFSDAAEAKVKKHTLTLQPAN